MLVSPADGSSREHCQRDELTRNVADADRDVEARRAGICSLAGSAELEVDLGHRDVDEYFRPSEARLPAKHGTLLQKLERLLRTTRAPL